MVTLTPTGIDDTAAIQAALATDRIVRLSEGEFFASGDLVISQQAAKFRGEGEGATKLTITTPNKPGIQLAPFLNDVEISGMTISRNVPAVTGGFGIDCTQVSCNFAHFHDLKIEHQFIGMGLGPTGWSQIANIFISRSVWDGLYMANTSFMGTLQWTLRHVLSQMNGGRGVLVITKPGPVAVTMGTWYDVNTFANSGCGAAFVGSAAVPLHGVRIRSAFLGQDGNHELYFDTFGDLHQVSDVFLELAGTGLTGPTHSTPASNVGFGLFMTANNGGLHAVNLRADNNSAGSFKLMNAQQRLRESVDTAGALVNVAGPTTIA
jgi:hypothetical protein